VTAPAAVDRDDAPFDPDAPSEDQLVAAVIGHAADAMGQAAHALQAVAALLSRRASLATLAAPRPPRADDAGAPFTLGARP
jgi:hypothetical protein